MRSLRIQSFSAPTTTKKFPFISQDQFFCPTLVLPLLSAEVSSEFQWGEILLKGGKSVFSTLQDRDSLTFSKYALK